ncbi:MAG: iron ABC transporter permease [Firmicutes bacterium]|nr:iron ABC transporter permease [Bacillota bacterium]
MVSLLFLGLLLLGLVLNITIGSVSISAGEVFRMLAQGIRSGIANLFTSGVSGEALPSEINATTESQILFSIRIPRMLLAAILGGALSISGLLLQVFFRNPIAGPFELGISSGAKMVVGITLIFLAPYIGNISSLTMIGAAFLGSLLITCVVLLFSQRVQNMSMLLVIGIMVGYVCSAVTDFCITFADDHDIVNLTNWSMGSFSGANWDHVKISIIICLIGLTAAALCSKSISAYSLGESYAKSMGINVKRFRLILILISSILSACVTAFAGPISFVGIAVPHITRTLLKTTKPLYMIPATFLCGAVFCVFCDLLARTVFAPTELKIGTVTSVFGAPIVIYMMVNRKKMEGV